MWLAMRPAPGDAGQAAAEAALTLPLMVFVVLGTLQLFLMLQARILTQYAAFRATRAGSMNYGDCTRMTHAALASLMPAITSFTGNPGIGSAGAKLAAAFATRSTDQYSAIEDRWHVANGAGPPGDIVWIARTNPTVAQVAAYGDQFRDFDQPTNDIDAQRLETRVVFWYPMKVPFANWVISRMALAQYGLMAFSAANPLMPVFEADWQASGWAPDAPIASALLTRVGAGEYVFPISANYTMRMMTPVKKSKWVSQNCPPAPAALR
jgi:hypothetical protein